MDQPQLHIVLIEPAAKTRTAIINALAHSELHNALISEAESATQGLLLCEEPASANPDIILLATDLPDRPGLTLLQDLHDRHGRPLYPVVLLVSDYQSDLLKDGVAAGAQDFVVKTNIRPELLAHIIHNAMERYRLIQTLALSEANYRSLADTLPVLIWVSGLDKGGIFFNQAWLGFTGRTLEQEAGYGWTASIHPEDYVRAMTMYEHAFDARQPFELDYRIRRYDGVYRWILDRGVPRYGPDGTFLGYLGGCIDVTERAEAEQALRQSEARQRALLAAMPDNVARMDSAGYYLDAHLSGDPPFPYPAESLIGRHISEVMPAETAALIMNVQRRAIATGKTQTAEYPRTVNGVEYILETRAARSGEDESVAIVRNITERKRADDLLMRAQKHESISLLASGIAHDFNNLLTSVLGQVSLARQKLGPNHPSNSNLEKAISATQRVAELTRQLLAYTGQGAYQVQEIDLNQLILDNRGLVETLLPVGARLQFDLAPDLPVVEMDRSQMQQVMMNLVINACEAMEHRNGVVRIATAYQEITTSDAQAGFQSDTPSPGSYVVLSIRDDGVGMDQKTMARIFDPYFTTKQGGSGLGLSATLGIVQSASGAVQVHSKAGEGTALHIFLPAIIQSAPAPQSVNQPSNNGRSAILVVDDEEMVREVVCDILIQEGMHVLVAADGFEGLDLFKSHRHEIDLLLVDMKMPGMDGEQLFYAVREIEPRCKIILSSGYLETGATNHLSRQPATSFLPKPYDLGALIDAVQRMLRSSEPSAV
jgi:two-component system cell cycle sensor histidine kinase/response regulator CckA